MVVWKMYPLSTMLNFRGVGGFALQPLHSKKLPSPFSMTGGLWKFWTTWDHEELHPSTVPNCNYQTEWHSIKKGQRKLK